MYRNLNVSLQIIGLTSLRIELASFVGVAAVLREDDWVWRFSSCSLSATRSCSVDKALLASRAGYGPLKESTGVDSFQVALAGSHTKTFEN